MSPPRLGLLTVTAFLAAPLPAFAGPPGAARTDFWGDPLPAGAVARLAPTRWRVDGTTAAVRYTLDGKRVLVFSKGSSLLLHQLDAADGRHLGRTTLASEPAFRWHNDPPTWCISPDG